MTDPPVGNSNSVQYTVPKACIKAYIILERVWNAIVTDAFGTQMERERSVRLFLSSTVMIQQKIE